MDAENFIQRVNTFTQSDSEQNLSTRSESRQRLTYKINGTYLRPKFDIHFVKTHFLSACIITILLICVIVLALRGKSKCDTNTYSIHSDPSAVKSDILPSNFSNMIVIANETSLWTFIPKDRSFSKVSEGKSDMKIFDLYDANTVFRIDRSDISMKSSSKEFTSKNYPKKWKPTAVAVDYVTDKLYILDEGAGSLNILDIHRKYYRTIVRNMNMPCDIVLDPIDALVFIVQRLDSILKVSMDGASITTIIQGDVGSSITIDRNAKIIYWVNGEGNIISSDYSGSDRKKLAQISVKIESLAMLNDEIFWAAENSLWYCRINDRVCGSISRVDTQFKSAVTIRSLLYRQEMSNPCKTDNGGCEHLCLLSKAEDSSGFVCECNDYWRLNLDLQTCRSLDGDEVVPTNISSLVLTYVPEGTVKPIDKNVSHLDIETWRFVSPTKKVSQLNFEVETFNNSLRMNFSEILAVSDGVNLWAMNLTSRNLTLLETSKTRKNFDVFDFFLDKTIFWCDDDTSTIISVSPEYSSIKYPSKWKPKVMRVDFLNENIYFIDGRADTVNVMDMQGKHYGIAISDLENPSDLTLDPVNNLMFIALKSKSVLKADMNGDNVSTLAQNSGISCIAIDRKARIIYMGINFIGIESMTYTGANRSLIKKISTKIDSLALNGQNLFWTSKSVLWTCAIENGSCSMESADQIHIKEAKTIGSPVSSPKVYNPCTDNDRLMTVGDTNCQHLCFLSSSRGPLSSYNCACSVGWEVNPNDRTCKPATEFILYTQGNLIRARILNPLMHNFVDAILPTEFQIEPLSFKDAIDFDYDMHNDYFIFSDDHNIYRINIHEDGIQEKLLHVSDDYQLKDVAYDWMTGNLYYVQKSKDNSSDHSLMVLKVTDEARYQKTITSFTHESDYPMKACPHSLIVHPEKGYLYYTAWNNVRKDIQRTTTNGKGLKEIGNVQFHNRYRILGMDYKESRLYWIADRWKVSQIQYANLDGNEVRTINITQIPYPSTIYIHQQWMYLSNASSIWRFNKKTGSQGVQMIPRFETRQVVSGVRIVSPSIQSMSRDHPCVYNNGGCQQLCFATPAKVCDCNEDHYIYNGNFCH